MSDGWLVRVSKRLEHHTIGLSQAISSLVLSVYLLWSGWWWPSEYEIWKLLPDKKFWFWISNWTPWIGLMVFGLYIYVSYKSASAHRELKDKNELLRSDLAECQKAEEQLEEAQQAIAELNQEHHQNLYQANSDYLALLLKDQYENDDTVRASLYMHNGSRFILAGRFTANPLFCQVNRKYFDDDQGIIGAAWHSGSAFVELPDTPVKKGKMLERDYNMPESVVSQLRMDSCVYCGVAIGDHKARIGVILFEATRKGVLDESYLLGLFESHKTYIVDLLSRFRSAYERVRTGTEGADYE